MSDTMPPPRCLACERPSGEVPLIPVQYRGRDLWICPQHLPILIHKPEQLADRLPGISTFGVEEPDE